MSARLWMMPDAGGGRINIRVHVESPGYVSGGTGTT